MSDEQREPACRTLLATTKGSKLPDILEKPKDINDLGNQVFQSSEIWKINGTTNCYFTCGIRHLSSDPRQDERALPFAIALSHEDDLTRLKNHLSSHFNRHHPTPVQQRQDYDKSYEPFLTRFSEYTDTLTQGLLNVSRRIYFMTESDIRARAFLIALNEKRPMNCDLNIEGMAAMAFDFKPAELSREVSEAKEKAKTMFTSVKEGPYPQPFQEEDLPDKRNLFLLITLPDHSSPMTLERVFHTKEYYRPSRPCRFFQIPLAELSDNKDLINLIEFEFQKR